MNWLINTLFILVLSATQAMAVEMNEKEQARIEAVFGQVVDQDLLRVRTKMVTRLRSQQLNVNQNINLQNATALAELNSYRTDRQVEGRVNALTRDQAQLVLNSIEDHPVVSSYVMDRYNQPNVEIGFCFGRAAYVHIALLQMGVNKDSIKKVWAVGPMQTGPVSWDFHVATLVKSTEGQWLAIDNFVGRIMTIEEWMAEINKISQAGHKNRYYFSQPQKFSVSLGTYDRVQLGLDLTKKQDWYRGYFSDLMKWFQENQLSTVGLQRL